MISVPTIDPSVRATYGDVKLAYVLASGLVVGQTPPRLKKIARAVEADVRADAQVDDGKQRLDDWAQLAQNMGLTQSSDLPAPHALVRDVLRGRTIPKINFVVDTANIVALKFMTPVGVFDLDALEPPISLRLARNGEEITPIAADAPVACVNREIVYAERSRVFSRYSRDAEFSKVTDQTTRILCVVDGTPEMSARHVLEAAEYLVALLRDVAGESFTVEGPELAVLSAGERLG